MKQKIAFNVVMRETKYTFWNSNNPTRLTIDVFLINNRILQDEYNELVALLNAH